MWVTGKLTKIKILTRSLTSRLPIDRNQTGITNTSVTVIPTTEKNLRRVQMAIVI